ncbi:hypothetical protein PC129_g24704 [Phytophthora cactorum]|uniref:Uncharacterized protein n=1 Tax=Phytophthora cactorum TaxID=29920 RepID=A0A329SDT6_9STRA|nr:hypothetical protein Pcac1_g9496 [Phytophthora cactorum]KAG3107536.1 hypothetical protein PI125_g12653 [Phytophthora idaei]KAG2780706.1 hypothetical protein Pcac1_g9495 [Phytophthora cactorum]KAG2784775.1 hypothetical protein PC111_g24388 [Phytophthora cactorum]KAG2787936.1 hypothetical protein PC112_g24522 [Phytophthora cactorum]
MMAAIRLIDRCKRYGNRQLLLLHERWLLHQVSLATEGCSGGGDSVDFARCAAA